MVMTTDSVVALGGLISSSTTASVTSWSILALYFIFIQNEILCIIGEALETMGAHLIDHHGIKIYNVIKNKISYTFMRASCAASPLMVKFRRSSLSSI